MPPPTQAPGRALTLTEELEKLDQAITLTLQGLLSLSPILGRKLSLRIIPSTAPPCAHSAFLHIWLTLHFLVEIDHNFSRAHLIITSSILPIIEQYAQHSTAVWEGSKFWKTFFEASANVSLSGYEELAAADLTALSTSRLDEGSRIRHEDAIQSPEQRGHDDAAIAHFNSPYEALKREIQDEQSSSVLGAPPTAHNTVLLDRTPSRSTSTSTATASTASRTDTEDEDEEEEETIHGLPQRTTGGPSSSREAQAHVSPPSTPQSSPFRSTLASASGLDDMYQGQSKPQDRLLHHVLDKTYRLQATPRKPYTPSALPSARKTPATGYRTNRFGADDGTASLSRVPDEPWSSSPVGPAPELDNEIFSSPAKRKTPTRQQYQPRTPNTVSSVRRVQNLQTPQRQQTRGFATPAGKTAQAPAATPEQQQGYGTVEQDEEITWSADLDSSDVEDGGEGMSPPKTIQFYIPDEQRVVRTPGKYFFFS
jgi:DASH complex subunit ASK1